jgi:hypothetical protein
MFWELQKHCFEQGVLVYFTFAQAARVVSYYERLAA